MAGHRPFSELQARLRESRAQAPQDEPRLPDNLSGRIVRELRALAGIPADAKPTTQDPTAAAYDEAVHTGELSVETLQRVLEKLHGDLEIRVRAGQQTARVVGRPRDEAA